MIFKSLMLCLFKHVTRIACNRVSYNYAHIGRLHKIHERLCSKSLFKLDVDNIVISLLGNMMVDTREILINAKEVSEQKIQIITLILKRAPCLV